jgi:tetratricopeptide (TPR) repeat protein
MNQRTSWSLIVCLLASTAAQAQPAPAATDEAPNAREQARTLMREGNEKLDQGLYLEALERFERARALVPSPKLLFNIAQTLNELGRKLEALQSYERFVNEVKPDEVSELARTAHERIFRLEGEIARIDLQTNVAEVQVAVDGKPAGATPLNAPLRVMPGAHAVVLTHPGYERQVLELSLAPGELASRRVTMQTEEEMAATRRAVQRAEGERRASDERLRRAVAEERRRRAHTRAILRGVGLGALAVGVAGLGVGGLLGGLSSNASSTVERAADGTPWTSLASSYDRAAELRTGAVVTLSIGAALAVAGGVLVTLGVVGARERRPASLAARGF